MHKARAIKTHFTFVGMEDVVQHNSTNHFLYTKEQLLHTRPPHPASVPDLPNNPVAEWAPIPTAVRQNVQSGKL